MESNSDSDDGNNNSEFEDLDDFDNKFCSNIKTEHQRNNITVNLDLFKDELLFIYNNIFPENKRHDETMDIIKSKYKWLVV